MKTEANNTEANKKKPTTQKPQQNDQTEATKTKRKKSKSILLLFVLRQDILDFKAWGDHSSQTI